MRWLVHAFSRWIGAQHSKRLLKRVDQRCGGSWTAPQMTGLSHLGCNPTIRPGAQHIGGQFDLNGTIQNAVGGGRIKADERWTSSGPRPVP